MSLDCYLGEVQVFTGDFAPVGWEFCHGQLLRITEHSHLFALIGTHYGGDGQQTFALPDLRGRVALHIDGVFSLGLKGGSETVILTTNQLPSHSHTPALSANSQQNNNGPANGYWAASPGEPLFGKTGDDNVAMNTESIAATGGGLGHENRVPFIALNYIIAVAGIYPNRQ